MKPSIVPANKTSSATSQLTVLPTAKIVRHPQAKHIPENEEDTLTVTPSDLAVDPPDEETLNRLNAMAKQYPFCIHHRAPFNKGLL